MTRARLLVVSIAMAVAVSSCALIGDGNGDETESGSRAGSQAEESAEGEASATADGSEASEGDGASGDDAGSVAEASGGRSATAPATIEADFEEGNCGFDVPAGSDPRCGTVSVPMDWSTGEGEIDLAVAVFASTSNSPAPDPVVYLEGGPGGHALETIRFVTADLLEPLQERGDVVFFDQRGAGLSQPRLTCPEIEALEREIEDQLDVDDDETEQRFQDALSGCGQRLTDEGIDLGSFNSINNAHDVEAIRVALGYEQWNLHGISYGTKLGLEVLRQHPEGVRTVILDSVFPPEVDSALENPSTFLDSYEAVLAACAAEQPCAEGGDLGQRLAAVVQRYDAEPVEVEVRNLLTGSSDEIYLRGETIIGVVNQALYAPLWFTDLPELVTELEDGRTDAIESFLSQQRTNEPFFSPGMFYAIECNEEIVFADPDAVAAALPPDPFGLNEHFNYASNNGSRAFSTCEAFGSDPAAAISNEAVVSDTPALVMAGRYDPVTPVSWAEVAAAGLANSHLVIDPFDSHGVSTGECGMSVVIAFLDDPATRPDSSCFDDGELRFLTPPDGSVTLETVTRPTSGGGEVTTSRPQSWTHGELPGDSYRQASFLDPTQLLQVADEPLLRLGLEFYLNESFDVVLGASQNPNEIGGRNWTRRSGANERVAAEWYETEISGASVFVVLVSTPDELEANIETILMPALETIDVS